MLLVVHAALTWALIGLILTIQFVHYPLFSRIGPSESAAYQQAHITRITTLVAPLMLGELMTGAALVWHPPPFLSGASTGVGLALITVIWVSTAVIQSPIHGRLAKGFDPVWHARLVTTNWVRTVLWVVRGVLVGWWLLLALR